MKKTRYEPILFLICSGLLALALAARMPAAAADTMPLTDLSRLAFLAGSWRSTSEGSMSEEHWLPPAGGVMLGVHRTVRGDGAAFFEYLRIETGRGGILSYVASPMGRSETAFRLIEIGDRRAVFAAKRRDFPTKISYWLDENGVLHARAEGEVRGEQRVEEWSWTGTSAN